MQLPVPVLRVRNLLHVLSGLTIIFCGIYRFNSGEVGLMFLPIGIGALFACALYLHWDRVLERAKAQNPPAAWSQSEEYRRLPLACIGRPLLVLSFFWCGCMSDQVTQTVPRDYSVNLRCVQFGHMLSCSTICKSRISSCEVLAAVDRKILQQSRGILRMLDIMLILPF